MTQLLDELPWRKDGHPFVAAQLQQVAVTADDGIGLPHHRQCEELIIVRITGGTSRCSSILVPERQLHQCRQKLIPDRWFAIAIELGSIRKLPRLAHKS